MKQFTLLDSEGKTHYFEETEITLFGKKGAKMKGRILALVAVALVFAGCVMDKSDVQSDTSAARAESSANGSQDAELVHLTFAGAKVIGAQVVSEADKNKPKKQISRYPNERERKATIA